MLIIGRKTHESIIIDNKIEIIISEISGDRVQLAIDAPSDVLILRKELYETKLLNEEATRKAPQGSLDALALALQNKKEKKNDVDNS